MFQASIEKTHKNTQVQRLLECLNYTYHFVEAPEAAETIGAFPTITEHLVRQTLECAYFICDYTGQHGSSECTFGTTAFVHH